MADAKAEDFFNWQREKKSAEVDGIGTIYYYDPQTVAERDAYERHMRYADDGTVSVSLEGIVDGIIARVKNVDSKPLFYAHHRSKLMEMPYPQLSAIWRAIGGAAIKSAAPLSDVAAKK